MVPEIGHGRNGSLRWLLLRQARNDVSVARLLTRWSGFWNHESWFSGRFACLSSQQQESDPAFEP